MTASSPEPALQLRLRPDLPPVRLGVARDAAFCFLYHDNVRLLEQAGATIVYFSPLADTRLALS